MAVWFALYNIGQIITLSIYVLYTFIGVFYDIFIIYFSFSEGHAHHILNARTLHVQTR